MGLAVEKLLMRSKLGEIETCGPLIDIGNTRYVRHPLLTKKIADKH